MRGRKGVGAGGCGPPSAFPSRRRRRRLVRLRQCLPFELFAERNGAGQWRSRFNGCSVGNRKTQNRTRHFVFVTQGGCITKLERFILDHLKIIGAVGVGIACVQVSKDLGACVSPVATDVMVMTCLNPGVV